VSIDIRTLRPGDEQVLVDCAEAWVLSASDNHAAAGLYASAGGKLAAAGEVMFSFDLGSPVREGNER